MKHRYQIGKFLWKHSLFMAAFFFCSLSLRAQTNKLEQELWKAIQGKQATVGIAVKIPGTETVTLNDEGEYPTMSVYKFHLALAVADYMERNNLPPKTPLYITKAQLLPNTYSPLRDKYPQGELNLSIKELLYYSVSLSDNNACDILFSYVGGTKAVDTYIRTWGIQSFAIVTTEEEMHQDMNPYRNWTSPSAAADLMETFLTAKRLSPIWQELIYTLLTETQTGADKLKAGLPQGVVLGHKTGSSFRDENGIKAGDNDLGFVCLPSGNHYSIAVFIKDSKEDDSTNAAMIAEISRIVYEFLK